MVMVVAFCSWKYTGLFSSMFFITVEKSISFPLGSFMFFAISFIDVDVDVNVVMPNMIERIGNNPYPITAPIGAIRKELVNPIKLPIFILLLSEFRMISFKLFRFCVSKNFQLYGVPNVLGIKDERSLETFSALFCISMLEFGLNI